MADKKLAALLESCSGCGQCAVACPVYNVTGREPDSPRGRVMLLLAARGERFVGDVAAAISTCLCCGKCEAACPARLPLAAAFLRARLLARRLLPVLPGRALTAKIFGLGALGDIAQTCAALTQRTLQRREKVFPPMPLLPYRGKGAGRGKRLVLFYPGCVARRFFPHLVRACVAALARSGYAVMTPALGCCGRLQAMQGRGIVSLVKSRIAQLAKLDFFRLATSCPACLDSMVRIWAQTPGLDAREKEQLGHFAARCIDINTLVAESAGRSARTADLFWHRPCLLRDDAQAAVTSQLGDSIQAVSDPASCCGAPLFCLGPQNSVSAAPDSKSAPSAYALALNIRNQAAGAAMLVTACPGCMLALKRVVRIPVRHSMELF